MRYMIVIYATIVCVCAFMYVFVCAYMHLLFYCLDFDFVFFVGD